MAYNHHHNHHGHHHHGPPQPPPPNDTIVEEYSELNFGAGNKWIKSLTRNRLDTFTGGHFAGVNLSSALFEQRRDGPDFVKLQVWSAPDRTKPSFEEAMKQKFKPAKKTNHWWKVTITIPEQWLKYERIQLEFDPGCEAMVFTTDGVPLQGITGGQGGDRRVDHIIPIEARKAGTYKIIIESSCNGMFGIPMNGDIIQPPDMNRYFSLASADLVVPNEEAWRLLWDFETLKQITDSVQGRSSLQNKALVVANEIMNAFDKNDPDAIQRARKIAEEVFGEGWSAKKEKVYEEGPEKALIWGIGHCHIDTAWLWPYSVTQQKVARSWSTQLDLMDRYPEHRFAASSAQQYKWLKQLYPSLFKRIQKRAKEGKFEAVGGAWVEHDANMPSGEALVRQFLYGQRFFERELFEGVKGEKKGRSGTAWLPDSFGLTGAMPQLIRGAGMKYFFTQKLSWNNINVFPHSTFNWVGLDGSQVLCHMTPVDTYTAQATVGDIMKGQSNHKNIESSDKALLVFGNGDGGGGPLNKMLENLRRIRAANNNNTEIPTIHMGKTVDEFFSMLEDETKAGKVLPNWHGELYLEFHRGTYTSHGSIKKGNRHSEILLRDIEHVATLASLQDPSYAYPKKRIDDAWEKVLLNQFHDVLPGSAIGMVYDDAEKLYAEVREDGQKMLEEAFEVLFPSSLPFTPISPYRNWTLSSPHSSTSSDQENSKPTSAFAAFHSAISPLTNSFFSPNSTTNLSASNKSAGAAETAVFKYPNTDIAVYNTTPFPRVEIVQVPLANASAALRGCVMQTSDEVAATGGANGETRKAGYVVARCGGGMGPGGVVNPSARMSGSGSIGPGGVLGTDGLMPVSVWSNGSDHFVLRNASVELTIANGRISSLLDVKLNRELIAPGETGGLVIFQDRPNYWDAWDVEIHHLETAKQLAFSNVQVVAQGPLTASVQAELVYDKSVISVTITLNAVGATVKEDSRSFFRFDAKVDWRQRHEFLKFELPLNLHNSYATYETQFGHLQRPTHKNTTWDIAKFEVCAHKYADLSEFGYGVALLSESKYGFSCTGNVLRISLLRSATAPDANQDQGEHTFSWAVMPHKGHFLESDVPISAFLFNSPLHIRSITNHPNGGREFWPLDEPFTVSGARNVFLETIKRGEDDTFPEPPTPPAPEPEPKPDPLPPSPPIPPIPEPGPKDPDEGEHEGGGGDDHNGAGEDEDSEEPGSPAASFVSSQLESNDGLEASMHISAHKDRKPPKEKLSTVVLRLYEAYGGHASAELKFHRGLGVYKAALTNLLEDDPEEGDGSVLFHLTEEDMDEEEDGEGAGRRGAYGKSAKKGQAKKGKKDPEGRKVGYNSLTLEFRAFEVKTVKLWIREKETKRQSWITVEGSSVFM